MVQAQKERAAMILQTILTGLGWWLVIGGCLTFGAYIIFAWSEHRRGK